MGEVTSLYSVMCYFIITCLLFQGCACLLGFCMFFWRVITCTNSLEWHSCHRKQSPKVDRVQTRLTFSCRTVQVVLLLDDGGGDISVLCHVCYFKAVHGCMDSVCSLGGHNLFKSPSAAQLSQEAIAQSRVSTDKTDLFLPNCPGGSPPG